MGFKIEKYEICAISTFTFCFIFAYFTFMNTYPLNELSIEDSFERKLICYYNLPHENNSLQTVQLEANLCTHIIIGFSDIKNNSIIIEEQDAKTYKDVVALKQINKNLKVMLSVGGNRKDHEFALMIENHANRKMFIRSLKKILRTLKLDGIDLDWEFPGLDSQNKLLVNNRGRQHFSQLLREIRMEYLREKRPYILSIAVAAPKTIVDISYDIKELNKYVDFVNVMTYDFHFYSKLTPFTGLNSPLYGSPDDILYWSTLNINYTVFNWLNSGMQREKIIVGLPTYGHSFTLMNPINNKIQSPAKGFGSVGQDGFVKLSEVCWFIIHNIFLNMQFDETACSPYLSSGNEWISYENTKSIECKTQFVKDNQFGGVMIYALGSDDFQGSCTKDAITFPLVKKVKQILQI